MENIPDVIVRDGARYVHIQTLLDFVDLIRTGIRVKCWDDSVDSVADGVLYSLDSESEIVHKTAEGRFEPNNNHCVRAAFIVLDGIEDWAMGKIAEADYG